MYYWIMTTCATHLLRQRQNASKNNAGDTVSQRFTGTPENPIAA